jgi:hypothetical protein
MKVKEKKLNRLNKNEDKNATWHFNDSLIMEAYDKLYDENKEFPSYKKLSEETGLSRQTICKHAESITLEKIADKFKLAGTRVFKKLLKNIDENGRAAEVKLFNQIILGYRESMELTGKDGKDLITTVKVNIIKPK